MARVSGLGLVMLVIAVALGPLLAPHPVGTQIGRPFAPPTAGFPFGSDHLGRDVLSQMMHTAPQTIFVPLTATLLLIVLGGGSGMLLGLVSPRARGPVLRLLDVVIVVPPIVLVLVVVAGWGTSLFGVLASVVLAGFAIVTRVVAAATEQIAGAGHVEAAFGYGDSRGRVMRREILPRVGGVLLAEGGLRFLAAIQLVAALSFLGFGAGLGGSWASAIRDSSVGLSLNPWSVIAPCAALALVAVAVTGLADLARRSDS